MVSLPRTCRFCSAKLMHYGSCTCTDSQLDKIDAEKKQITQRLAELNAEERRLIEGTLADLGVIKSAVT